MSISSKLTAAAWLLNPRAEEKQHLVSPAWKPQEDSSWGKVSFCDQHRPVLNVTHQAG